MANRLAQIKANAKRNGWAKYLLNENDERAALEGYIVHEPLGVHVCDFFAKFLRHSKGRWAGKPFILSDVQRDEIIMPLYSWVHQDTGRRRFRNADMWVPKKNFKSTLGAGLALYGLRGDNEPGAEVYTAANDKKQAGIVFGAAADMVEASPRLMKDLRVTRSTKTVSYGNNAWLQALSADVATKEGLNAFYIIIDEIHVFDKRGTELFETLRYATIAREDPLIVVISTAGDDDTGIGYEQYSYAKGVLNGDHPDIHHFAYIAEAGEKDDWTAEATWAKANPMLGETISVDEMAAECEKAKRVPRLEAKFRRYRLNQWVKSSTPWIPVDAWKRCGGVIDEAELIGRPCGAGLDLAIRGDLSASCLCFPPIEDDEPHKFLWHYWLPRDRIIDREKKDRVPYRKYADEGWLTLTDGNTCDQQFIKRDLVERAGSFEVRECGYDQWNAEGLAQSLQDDHGMNMVAMRQGVYTLGEATKKFEDLFLGGDMRHGDNPITNMQAKQVSVKPDANGNIRPIKSDGKRFFHVDGIVAAVMALARSMQMREQTSVYENRGVVIL